MDHEASQIERNAHGQVCCTAQLNKQPIVSDVRLHVSWTHVYVNIFSLLSHMSVIYSNYCTHNNKQLITTTVALRHRGAENRFL